MSRTLTSNIDERVYWKYDVGFKCEHEEFKEHQKSYRKAKEKHTASTLPIFEDIEPDVRYYSDGSCEVMFGGPCGSLYLDYNGDS